MSSIALRRSLHLAANVRAYIGQGKTLEKALFLVCSKVSKEERAATQAIIYNSLRRALLLEALIRQLSNRPPFSQVRHLLACGLSELIDKPEKAYAIVNETIAAAKIHEETQAAAGFINACLRRFIREKETLIRIADRDPCVRLNAPRWWIERLDKEQGRTQADAILSLQKTKPPLTLRVNTQRISPDLWCQKAAEQGLQPQKIDKEAVLLTNAVPVENIYGFTEGLVSVQDAGAQLAAHFLTPKTGEKILDACAAPGGKTAHLLELAHCDVTALEIDPLRATRIVENLERLGLSAHVKQADAAQTDLWWDGSLFDSILLDAPCTASGIVRRHPDIVFFREPRDIAQLAKQQQRLLNALWPCLRIGGKLLYVVCSIFEEEGQQQIARFLAKHPDASAETLPGTHQKELRLLPADTGVDAQGIAGPHDGFFYALLTKKNL